MRKMKSDKSWRKFLLPFGLLMILLVPIVSVVAESVSGEMVIVESNETLEKTSFLSGEYVRVDGDINGTTFITGGNIEVNGTINGDLFIAGQSVIVNGKVNGSTFLTGQYLTLNGEIENNIYGIGQGLKVQSQTNGDLFMVGQNVSIDEQAVIARDVLIGAGTINHKGIVNGDFQSSSDSLAISGKVVGNLDYSSPNQANFSETSEVLGETTWKEIGAGSVEASKPFFSLARFLRLAWSIGAALIVWLVVRWVKPSFWTELADQIRDNPLRTLGFGVLGVIAIPIVSILLMVSIIGIPLSLILLTLYGIVLYSSKIILSVYLSRFLQNRLNGSNTQAFWLFLLTLVLLTSLAALPIAGMIIGLLTISFGVGAIGTSLLDRQS